MTITEETFFSHGWQPLTISILQTLWFLPSDTTFDIPFLVDWFARLGWKGANGKPMGERVILREIGLMREAGYVTATRLRGEGGKTIGIQYAVSQRRRDQPQTGAWLPVTPAVEENRRSNHMSSMATRGESPHVAIGENRRSDHASPLTTCGESPHVVNGAKPQVAPHVAYEISPPHPPEEVTTSSPYPLTNTSGPTGLPSPREEGEGALCSEEDVRVAVDVLELLPAPWTQGKLNAGKLAPKLLTVMAAQGWPGIRVVDRGLLMRQLTKNPHRVTNPYRLLAGDRIPNLPRYAVVAAEAEAVRPPGATSDGMCSKHPTYRAGNRCIPCITA
ncbi:hypothetical protein ACFWA4_05180 [Streptomyces sp. NPDC060011]|uniref:hypothetical protein n=1 Tax=Streptomyces sp. NPDC060011 TaxID=3347037 RepID=UPI003680BFFE